MTCSDISTRLDDYLDGALPPDQVRQVEEHLAGCDRCRAELAGLRSILADARTLPRTVLPSKDLWSGIEARLPAPAPAVLPLRPRRPLLQRPVALLAAALFLLLAGATLATLYLRGPGGAASTFALEQQRYATATADLARRLADDPTLLSATTRAVVERNLTIVDQAIQEAEKALATDPGNTELEQMVLARYAQRLALLKHATEAGRRES
jgi:anti-sigma factor RsiW